MEDICIGKFIEHRDGAFGIIDGRKFNVGKPSNWHDRFMMQDDNDKLFAVGNPSLFKSKHIAFPQYNCAYAICDTTSFWDYGVTGCDFVADEMVWCSIKIIRAHKDSKTDPELVTTVEGSIELGDGLPLEFMLGFMMLFKRYEDRRTRPS